MQNYERVCANLTTPQLKQDFMNAINQSITFEKENNISNSGPKR